MKASAGSGKTFNLAKTYIELLLKSNDPEGYRHILAVTFTNKATDEMKKRILDELHTLASDPAASDYYSDFVPALFQSGTQLQKRSQLILSNILHDYSAFAVSTIDRFFQSAIRSFAREIGQFSTYQIELDKDSLIHEAADRLLDNLEPEDKKVLDWMEDRMTRSLSEGKKFSLDTELYAIAERAKSEELERVLESTGISAREAFDEKRLRRSMKTCSDVISGFEKKSDELKKAMKQALDAAGLQTEDFAGGSKSWLRTILFGAAPTDSALRKCSAPDEWFSKTGRDKGMAALSGTGFHRAAEEFAHLYENDLKHYRTARLLRDLEDDLILASEIREQFDAILKEKNVMSLDDTNTILRDIIGGSDTPFVYEKLGVRFEHFLLDEFQDTSGIQWDNFEPLLRESDSSIADGADCTNENLVVGDVKQCIYRWRGSDWGLLASELKNKFPGMQEKTLDENWRSSRNVVEFNNGFYEYIRDILALRFKDIPGIDIQSIYKDVRQTARKADGQDGYVRVSFTQSENILGLVKESIDSAIASGARYSDIAILVRRNKVGAAVAGYLIDSGYQVVSNDSLQDNASATVRRVIALLSAQCRPEDAINSFLSSELGIDLNESHHNLLDACEYYIRELRKRNPEVVEAEIPYINSFMDEVQNWTSKYGNDMAGFLSHWKENADKFKVSSPENDDAITIITAHKSKGLEFPYVIMPFADDNGTGHTSMPDVHWSHIRIDNGPLKDMPEGIFPLDLRSSLDKTLLEKRKDAGECMRWIDALNTFYVSTTRACKGLHIIAEPHERPAYISDYLYAYLNEYKHALSEGEYVLGQMYDFSKLRRSTSQESILPAQYPSFAINSDQSGTRLELSRDAIDFFSDNGLAGASASRRRKGVVYHDILSKVTRPGDLRAAVDEALSDARLTEDEAAEAYGSLSKSIADVQSRYGWFNQNCSVRNEADILDINGEIKRPDRVELHPDGSVVIIDFKFGEEERSYKRQVQEYMNLYSRMGYSSVRGYLWYVNEDEIKEVDQENS